MQGRGICWICGKKRCENLLAIVNEWLRITSPDTRKRVIRNVIKREFTFNLYGLNSYFSFIFSLSFFMEVKI